MRSTLHFGMAVLIVLSVGQALGQTAGGVASDADDAATKEWSFSLATSGYLVPHDQSYASPTFTADHQWLHLEARYNYEAQQTGSLWAGYNLSAGHTLVFEATPMLGAVFGNMNGIAPGCELSLAYKRLELSSQIELVINPSNSEHSFLYSWDEFVYTPVDWFHAGLVAQRTRAYHTSLDVQRGFSVGFSHRKVDFTTYIFNAGWTNPTVVFALGFKF